MRHVHWRGMAPQAWMPEVSDRDRRVMWYSPYYPGVSWTTRASWGAPGNQLRTSLT